MKKLPIHERVLSAIYRSYEHRFAWNVIAFILGILFFFKYQPDISVPCAIGITAGIGSATLLIYKRFHQRGLFVLFFFLLGLTAILIRTALIDAPPLRETQRGIVLTGEIIKIIPGDEPRLILRDIQVENDISLPQLRTVRLVVSDQTPLHVGDRIRATTTLYPPSIVSKEYALRVYYESLSALGRAYTINVLQPAYPTHLSVKLENFRSFIFDRITQVLPAEEAAVAIPLILGEQGVVPDHIRHLYRQAGITHVLSVSGFHMVLVAGFMLLFFRKLGSLCPPLAARVSIKKLAAVLALLGSFGYLMISGLQTPAIRSFIMIAFVLTGMLFDRRVVSFRSLFLALFGLLLFRPEYVLSISFQLSFMATFVLVAFYEAFRETRQAHGMIRKALLSVGASSVVSLATLPFIIYHFGQMNPYGVLGNLLTSALFTFLIMPCLFLGLLMMPIGLETPFWHMAGWGLQGVSHTCSWIANFPYAEINIASISSFSLFLMTLGVWMFCLLKAPLRPIGLIPIFFACFLI